MTKQKSSWVNVRVPKGLMDEVDRFIEESQGSFTSKADFVKSAIREKLTKKDDVSLARDIITAIKKSPNFKKSIK